MVWLWVTLRRERLGSGRPVARQVQVFTPSLPIPPVASASFSLPASRRLSWLLVLPQSSLDEDQQRLQQYLRQFPELEAAFTFTQQFLTIVHHHRSLELQPWIDTCSTSGLPELASFAQGLQRDLPIIQPALELPYSNGVAEGHINRLKTIKRSMYGRANFDLLRLRVLSAA